MVWRSPDASAAVKFQGDWRSNIAAVMRRPNSADIEFRPGINCPGVTNQEQRVKVWFFIDTCYIAFPSPGPEGINFIWFLLASPAPNDVMFFFSIEWYYTLAAQERQMLCFSLLLSL